MKQKIVELVVTMCDDISEDEIQEIVWHMYQLQCKTYNHGIVTFTFSKYRELNETDEETE